MARYQLSNAAAEDLSEIYTYSYLELGELRADAYFESLENGLQRVAENPLLGVDVGRLRRSYYRFVHQRHSIYYRKSGSGILVVRTLGPGMSVERNLP